MGVPVTAHPAGVPPSAPGKSWRRDYANRLRLNVREGRDSGELVDQPLVFALIELRSCKPFDLLARHCRGRDAAPFRFTIRPGSSELGHYHVFFALATWLFAPSKRAGLSLLDLSPQPGRQGADAVDTMVASRWPRRQYGRPERGLAGGGECAWGRRY